MIDYNIIKKGSGVFSKNSYVKMQCEHCKCEFVVNGKIVKNKKEGIFIPISCPDCGLQNLITVYKLELYEGPIIDQDVVLDVKTNLSNIIQSFMNIIRYYKQKIMN